MIRVLVVDDEISIRDIIKHYMTSHFEAEVIEADSGELAIMKIKECQDLELVLCDYRMPNGDGGAVYKFIKESGLKIPYIMMSTDPPEKYPVFEGIYTENVKNSFLPKPFRKDLLIKTLEKALNK